MNHAMSRWRFLDFMRFGGTLEEQA